jgi:hypothetical protein
MCGATSVAIEAQIWNVQCWMVSGGVEPRAFTTHSANSYGMDRAIGARSHVVGGNMAAATTGSDA